MYLIIFIFAYQINQSLFSFILYRHFFLLFISVLLFTKYERRKRSGLKQFILEQSNISKILNYHRKMEI